MIFPEFLNLQGRERFTAAWYAANKNRREFYAKYYRHVDTIDVAKLSEDIIAYVSTEEPVRGLSLVLSSNLMLGAVRILNYQTDAALRMGSRFWKSSNAPKIPEKKKGKKRLDFPADTSYEVPQDLPNLPDFTGNVANEDLITLRDDIIMVQDPNTSYFGPLTTEEVELMLTGGRLFPDLEEPTESAPASKPSRIPSIRDPELPQAPVEMPPSPYQGSPQTPSKRLLSLPLAEPQETPPKKPRVPGIEDAVQPILPVEPPTILPIEPPTILPVEPTTVSSPLRLELLHSSNEPTRRTRRKPRRLIRDEEMQLSSTVMRHQLENRFFQTRPHAVGPSPHPQPLGRLAEMFENPTRRGWGQALLLDYQMMILQVISEPMPSYEPEDPVRGTFPVEGPEEISGEIAATSSTADSTHLGEPIPIDKAEPVVLPRIEERQTEIQFPEVSVGEPEMPDAFHQTPEASKEARQTLKDWSTTRASHGSVSLSMYQWPEFGPADGQGAAWDTPDSTTRSIGPTNVKGDILARVEILWSEKRIVEFEHLCPPASCTRRGAAQVFALLLQLHQEQEVVLKQAVYFGSIFIQRHTSFD